MCATLPYLVLLALACQRDPPEESDPTDDTSTPMPAVSIAQHQDMVTLLEASWTMDDTVDACWLRYQVDDEGWRDTPARACSPGPQQQTILGLPPDSEVQVQLVTARDDRQRLGEPVLATTGALPLPELAPGLDLWDASQTTDHPWLLLALERYDGAYYDGPYWQIVLDRRGRVVWYRALPSGLSSTFPRPSRDGTHIVAAQIDRFGLAGGQPALIQRFGPSLAWMEQVEAPGLRFAWDEASDGSVYYFDRETEGEGWLSRIDRQGQRERLFDCAAWIADRCTDTWCCEANAVVLEPSRGSVLMSLWATDTVLEIDLETATVRHSWGQLEGSWQTEPASARFDLQHYPNFTPEGTLLVSTLAPDLLLQHRVREFTLDESAQVLREQWSWGEGQDLFPQYQGEALRLDNGNTLMNFGAAGAIREITGAGALAWSLTWSEPWLLGHMSLVDDLYALDQGLDASPSSANPTSMGSGARATPKR